MKKIIFDFINEILKSGSEQLALPLQQKAKFEGWFKIELAAKLQGQFGNTVLEPSYPQNSRSHADIYSNEFFIELKTSDTNCTCESGNHRNRLSINISAITRDICKLRESGEKGIIAIVLFPWDDSCMASIDEIRNLLKKKNIVEGSATTQGFYIFVAEV